VWVFDPQQVADEQPSWWWNPLTWVTDEVKAADLAEGKELAESLLDRGAAHVKMRAMRDWC